MNQTTAYMECYPDSTYGTARSGSTVLIAHPNITEEINRLKGLTEEGDVLSRKEKREFLARAMRTPVGEIDKDSILAEEITTTEYNYVNGSTGTKTKVKGMSKQAAIALDNQMAGDNEPETVKHNIVIEWGEEQ